VERPSTGLTPKATRPRELRPGRSVQQTASTSLRASRPSWSTIESKIWQHFSKPCARKLAMCSRRPTNRSTGNSDGSWIQRSTRLNSGNRHKSNEDRLLAKRTDVCPSIRLCPSSGTCTRHVVNRHDRSVSADQLLGRRGGQPLMGARKPERLIPQETSDHGYGFCR